MSVPHRQNGSDPAFRTEESLIAETIFVPGQTVAEILAFLRREKVGGTLTVNVVNGGVSGIRFRQSQPVVVED